MRRVLIDYARGRRREKRGGDAVHVPLAEALDVPPAQADDLLDLDEALTPTGGHERAAKAPGRRSAP
jgi:DNA-directed RNA polymerase specialized sigma24 family protein